MKEPHVSSSCSINALTLQFLRADPQLRQRGPTLSICISSSRLAVPGVSAPAVGGVDVPVDMPTFHPLRDGKEATG